MEGIWGGLVIALIDFLMVFLVLGGLALTIKGLKNVVNILEPHANTQKAPQSQADPLISQPAVEEPSEPDNMTDEAIAAIVTAIQQFTSLPPGTFTIDWIEPIEADEVAGFTSARQHKALIAAITIAIHEYTRMPVGSFQITGIKPLGNMNPWRVAGRLEAMGVDV